MGNLRIPILTLITIVIICWLAVINAQIFGYDTNFPPGCERVAGKQFGSFLDVSLYIHTCVCIYVCMYVYMYICTCTCMYCVCM